MEEFKLNYEAQNYVPHKEAKRKLRKKGINGNLFLSNLKGFGPVWKIPGKHHDPIPLWRKFNTVILEETLKSPFYELLPPMSIFYDNGKRYYISINYRRIIHLRYLENYELSIIETESRNGYEYDPNADSWMAKIWEVGKIENSYICWITYIHEKLAFNMFVEDEDFPLKDVHPNAINWEDLLDGKTILRDNKVFIYQINDEDICVNRGPFKQIYLNSKAAP